MVHSNAQKKTDAEPISQVEACYKLLRSKIVSCELAPGLRLTEQDLIACTGFGRTPVREALMRLDHDGLVFTRPRSGYRVKPLTEKTINDLYDIWRLVGPLTARLAYQRMTPEVRGRIAALDDVSFRPDMSLAEQVATANNLFEVLAEATENEQLIYICRRLWGDMDRLYTMFLSTEMGNAWLPSHGEMERLAKATDPDLVAARIYDAICASQAGIIEAFRQREPERLANLPTTPSKRVRARAELI